jgi:Bacterial-like globin
MFRGHGKDSQQRQFQLVVELICQKTGGPCPYIGRPMISVHDGLGISEANWSTFMKILSDGMNGRSQRIRLGLEVKCDRPDVRL